MFALQPSKYYVNVSMHVYVLMIKVNARKCFLIWCIYVCFTYGMWIFVSKSN